MVIKLPGNIFEYTVQGLLSFQEYSFWLKACTLLGCVMSESIKQKMLEGIPAGQIPPKVSLNFSQDEFLAISWDPPTWPNGNILYYRLYRRHLLETMMKSQQSILVYNGTAQSFTDFETLPYTKYQYQVVVGNSAGESVSDWSIPTRSGQAAPQGISAPTFGEVSANSVQIFCSEPELPNGLISLYSIYSKINASSVPFEQVTTGYGCEQTVVGLQAFTTYQFKVEVCTLKSLCTFSPSSSITTLPSPPHGQNPPQIIRIFSRNITLQWSLPSQLNGLINSFELHMKTSCPLPFQPFVVECVSKPAVKAYVGRSQEFTIPNLLPYYSYDFRVISVNNFGHAESEWTRVVTEKSQPEYLYPVTVTSNISSIFLDWSRTFMLNGVLIHFELFDEGTKIFTGFATTYRLKRTAAKVHRFQVIVKTDVGYSASPLVLHDTRQDIFYDEDLQKDKEISEVSMTDTPVYQTLWFIAVTVLICIMLVFSIVTIVLRRLSGNSSCSKTNFQHEMIDNKEYFPKSPENARYPLETSYSNRKSEHSMPTSVSRSMLQDISTMEESQNYMKKNNWGVEYESVDEDNTCSGSVSRKENTLFADTHL